MAPSSGLHQSSLPSDFDAPFRPLAARSSPAYLAPRLTASERSLDSDPNPRRLWQSDARERSRRRGGKRSWKKLLWVKQSYPDNYTDRATFLETLQRNPRLQPYEFWPLVADTTVIVQHVCSVIIFVTCFVGIFQERISTVSVVSLSSFDTFVGWCLYDWWVGKEAAEGDHGPSSEGSSPEVSSPSRGSRYPAPKSTSALLTAEPTRPSVARKDFHNSDRSSNLLSVDIQPPSGSASSLVSSTSQASGLCQARNLPQISTWGPSHRPSSPIRGGRAYLRANALKSAVLIYFTLLGLSPILKSLTRSTSSDSIWAMSFWLLAINVFFFDYSGKWSGVNNISVSSLSTNAGLMASTVLASRLPSTGQVFGLTLFSLEVFGLFPVFRRYARHRSWRVHVFLTFLLVLGAGGGVGMALADNGSDSGWPWRFGLVGMLVGCVIAAIAMGGCSWWLLGLQKYKNEIHGPWDPARPVIASRRLWDDD